MPCYINACNVVVIICYKKLEHLTHSLPLKSIEYTACRTPFVAPDIGGLPREEYVRPDMLYAPNSHEDLADKILHQLEKPRTDFPEPLSWESAGSLFSQFLSQK